MLIKTKSFISVFLPIFLSIFSWTGLVHLSESSAETSIQKVPSDINYSESNRFQGWSLFGGAAAGYGVVSGLNYSDAPHGGQYLLNGVLSYEIRNWVFDGGIGWIFSNEAGNPTPTQSAQVTTRAGLLELSPRYRLTNRFQLGLVLNETFGADTTFSTSVGQSTSTYFAGLKAVYEIPNHHFPVRLYSQLTTDISTANQRTYQGWVGLQIGFSFEAKKSQNVQVVLDSQRVFFGKGSSEVSEDVGSILKDVGHYLKEKETPSNIEVSGHADQRGSYQYNLSLSKERAESVRQALTSGGIDASKVKLNAYSFLRPLDAQNTEISWAKNRRVEILFNEVKDPEVLMEKLKPLTNLDSAINIKKPKGQT